MRPRGVPHPPPTARAEPRRLQRRVVLDGEAANGEILRLEGIEHFEQVRAIVTTRRTRSERLIERGLRRASGRLTYLAIR